MFLCSYLIDFVGSDEPTWKGVLYAVTLFAVAFSCTLLGTNANHSFYITALRTKSALVSAVYRKSLLLSNSAKRSNVLFTFTNLSI